MKTEPIKLTTTDLSNFVNGNSFCVIKAGLEEKANFNTTLNIQLSQFYKASLKIGFITTTTLDYQDVFVQSLIGEKMTRIGLESSDTLLPGYYLFKNSRLVAYHPGTFDISKLDPNVQKASMKFGLAIAVISGLLQKSFTAALLTFSATMEVPTGMNIFQFFKEILEAKSDVDTRQRQKQVFLDEVDKAYAFLKVSKTATDEEVKKAWKAMLKQFHPDKNMEDEDSRNKICISINEAFDIIMNHRKASKNKFGYSYTNANP